MAHRGRRALVAAVCGLSALAAATPGTQAQSIDVRASVTYVKRDYEFRRLRLRITRDARTWRSKSLGTTYFQPPRVRVRDLDADGEPEVWVDTYSGGAHCCFRSRFFRWVPERAGYAPTSHDWADTGYRLVRLDGGPPPELLSADARFAYVFTAFAASFFPVQIWHFERGRLLDVTHDFTARVQRDADDLWGTYLRLRRGRDDVRGVLAAWQADQMRLGRGDQGWLTLEAIRRRGVLGPRADLRGWPQGRSYLKALRTFLAKTGYA